MEKQGQGLETLGTILAVAGWGLAAVTSAMFLLALDDVWELGMGSAVAPILFSLATGLVACMALAGLGHLLRAVAQLGRNVQRLGRILAASAPPPPAAARPPE